LDEIELVVWHRFGYRNPQKWRDKGYSKDAEGVADLLERDTDVTGQKMAYHLVIGPYGAVDQALPFTYVAPHALDRYNPTSIGIAVIGDFRYERCTDAAWTSCVDVAYITSRRFTDKQHGHTALPGSSKDLRKVCPGQFFDMASLLGESSALRDSIDENEADKEMRRLGFIF